MYLLYILQTKERRKRKCALQCTQCSKKHFVTFAGYQGKRICLAVIRFKKSYALPQKYTSDYKVRLRS
jgi:hypothetical protein